jgi:hypothetical protein
MSEPPTADLQVCPDRASVNRDMHRTTGIYVRAKGTDGRWDSFDIAELNRDSLVTWLRSRGGDNFWAENCVLIMLGHDPLET